MAKVCKKCNASVNSKSMECPYCGSANFEVEFIEPVINSGPISQNIQSNAQSNQNTEIYSSKLEQLINLALSDGELTEKEKQVLFKKAEAEGIDLDEFEMVLDAKIKNLIKPNSTSFVESNDNLNDNQEKILNPNRYAEIEKLIEIAIADGLLSESEKNIIINKGVLLGIPNDELTMIIDSKVIEKQKLIAQTAAPKSDKLGDVKKCPACGAMVGAFKGICSDCGHEFSNIEATNSSQKLYQELIRVEEDERNRPIEKSGMPSIHSLFSGANDPQAEMKLNGRIYKRKIGVVSMFPIPNTKADILEFLSLAVSEGGKKIGGLFSPMSLEEREYIKAWRAKADQVVVKARFSLKDDKKLVEEINTYAKQLEIK